MHNARFFAATSVAVFALAFPAAARAQRTGFAVDRFEPSERGAGFFVMDTLDLRGGARPALGAVLDYGYKPLVAYDTNGNEKSAIVRHQLFTHLGGALVLGERLRLGLDVPVAVYQDGEPAVVNGDAFTPATKPALGDIRVSADLRLFGETTDPLTMAVGVRVWAPTGVRSQFTGDGSARVAPQAIAAGELGPLVYSARLAAIYRSRDDAYAGSSLGSELLLGGAAGIRALDRRLLVGPEVWASSAFAGDAFLKTRGTPVEGLFGAHYDVAREVRVGAGVGTGLTRGYGSPEVRGLFSLEWVAAPPAPPEPPPPEVPPPPPPDADGDGVPDAIDACPKVAGVRTNDPKTNGCPPDRDGDTIADALDACPDEKGVRTGDPKTNGCPPDRDGDAIADAVDACPDEKGVRTDDPKTNGCPPPPPDTDGDGILDPEDACPKVAGPKDPDPKKNGCPLVIVTEKEIRITEQVKFKFNSAEILKASDPVLEAVTATLKEHPEIAKVRVEGHTDDVGNAAYNKKLSARRADAVMRWLVKHGVDKKRLVSAGFGAEEPIDTNTTDEGRANNRRVAFVILERAEPKKP